MLNKDYSELNLESIPNIAGKEVSIIVSTWNKKITDKLYEGAKFVLENKKCIIKKVKVPGSFELLYACKKALIKKPHAIIAIGCIIKGDTPHFDFISSSVANGISQLNLKGEIPVVFGVITANNYQQAVERCEGFSYKNKGVEAAVTAISMINLTV